MAKPNSVQSHMFSMEIDYLHKSDINSSSCMSQFSIHAFFLGPGLNSIESADLQNMIWSLLTTLASADWVLSSLQFVQMGWSLHCPYQSLTAVICCDLFSIRIGSRGICCLFYVSKQCCIFTWSEFLLLLVVFYDGMVLFLGACFGKFVICFSSSYTTMCKNPLQCYFVGTGQLIQLLSWSTDLLVIHGCSNIGRPCLCFLVPAVSCGF